MTKEQQTQFEDAIYEVRAAKRYSAFTFEAWNKAQHDYGKADRDLQDAEHKLQALVSKLSSPLIL